MSEKESGDKLYFPPYVIAGNIVYFSSIVGVKDSNLVWGGIFEETKQAVRNLQALVNEINDQAYLLWSPNTKVRIVSLQVMLKDNNDYGIYQSIFRKLFVGGNLPAESCHQAENPFHAQIAITAVGYAFEN